MSIERSDTSCKSQDCTIADFEEEQISESISRLRIEVNRIESTTGPSKRTHCMRNEIERLESQLAYSKNQDKERTDRIPKDVP